MISNQNRKKRKQFYEEHKGKTFDAFANFIFTDESTFKVIGATHGKTYYKRKNIAPGNHSFIRTKKFGGGSLMVWGMVPQTEN